MRPYDYQESNSGQQHAYRDETHDWKIVDLKQCLSGSTRDAPEARSEKGLD
jgi:hypothetical protein